MYADLNRLLIFFHVYNQLSITQAAEKLFVTPSATSQQIKKLEDEMKTSLFTRSHKKLIPTPAGTELFNLVNPLIKELEVGLERMQQSRTTLSGTIRIGAPLEFGSLYLPHFIAGFCRRYPNIDSEVVIGRPTTMMKLIAEGGVDFAFVDNFPTKEKLETDAGSFSIEPVIEEEVVLACSRQYNTDVLHGDHSLDSLKKATFLSQEQSRFSLNNWFNHHFFISARGLNVVFSVANHQAILSGIRSHMGLGVIVPHVVQNEVLSGDIVIVHKEKEQAVNKVSIVQLLNRSVPIREAKFISYFHEYIRLNESENDPLLPTGKMGFRYI